MMIISINDTTTTNNNHSNHNNNNIIQEFACLGDTTHFLIVHLMQLLFNTAKTFRNQIMTEVQTTFNKCRKINVYTLDCTTPIPTARVIPLFPASMLHAYPDISILLRCTLFRKKSDYLHGVDKTKRRAEVM